MNNIVLYRIVFSLGLLVLASGLLAQKPNIDLIPSSHQIMPTEAIIDTSIALDSMIQFRHDQDSGYLEKKVSYDNVKKERRQIGPSLDSLFRKADNRKAVSHRIAGKLTLYIKQYNPLKFFIRISAIK